MQKGPVRVVAVSSMVHSYGGLDLDDLHFRRRPYGSLKAYAQSKLCNILFINELARRYAGSVNVWEPENHCPVQAMQYHVCKEACKTVQCSAVQYSAAQCSAV